MKLRPKITLIDHFEQLTDPRVERTKDHKLIDIIVIALCAMICGADTFVAMETYGNSKYEWLKQFLELKNGRERRKNVASTKSSPGKGLTRMGGELS